MDRVLVISSGGPHYAFATGRVSAVLANDFREAISELTRELWEAGEVAVYVYGNTEVRAVQRLSGEQQLFMVVNDNALGDDTTLRKQVIRALKFMTRPLTPDDPEHYRETVPNTQETISA